MVPPVLRLTALACTKMVPPCPAPDAVLEVAAESVPPFWSVTALARDVDIATPPQRPWVLVKMPLPTPGDWTGVKKPAPRAVDQQ